MARRYSSPRYAKQREFSKEARERMALGQFRRRARERERERKMESVLRDALENS